VVENNNVTIWPYVVYQGTLQPNSF